MLDLVTPFQRSMNVIIQMCWTYMTMMAGTRVLNLIKITGSREVRVVL